MRRVLVTGATGGFGIALVQALLAQAYPVRATGRRLNVGARLRAAGTEFIAAELTEQSCLPALVAGTDLVVHAAALSSPWGRREDFQRINVTVTRDLLAAAQIAGCNQFVFISTPSIYSEPRDRLGLTEASPVAKRFANYYAASKYAAEQLVLAANKPGFSTAVLRPRALVGPDDTVLLPRLLRVARRGIFPLLRQGRALIELTDVRDAADAVLAIAARPLPTAGRSFNISGGAPMTVAAALSRVFADFDLRPRLLALPYTPIARLLRLAEIIYARLPGQPEPPATVYTLSTLAFSQTFDLRAARNELGWQPRFTPAEAIARTAATWRHHAPL
jgi:nucleoside-diphosphate-sugar epimerase